MAKRRFFGQDALRFLQRYSGLFGVLLCWLVLIVVTVVGVSWCLSEFSTAINAVKAEAVDNQADPELQFRQARQDAFATLVPIVRSGAILIGFVCAAVACALILLRQDVVIRDRRSKEKVRVKTGGAPYDEEGSKVRRYNIDLNSPEGWEEVSDQI